MKELILIPMAIAANFLMLKILSLKFNNKGEATVKPGEGEGEPGGDIKFTAEQQKVIDKVIDKRYASWKNEEKTKYGDYDDLRKFKDENLREKDVQQQQELEKSKKYDEAKQGYETRIKERDSVISKKELELNDLRINHTLTNEINKLNGYSEETLALIKSQAILDANGNVFIKGKDANGIDTQLSAADGIKKLLDARPYLVKSNHKPGSGTGSGDLGTSGQTSGGGEDLSALNEGYKKAFYSGDLKKANEFKIKMKTKMAERSAQV